MKVHLVGSNVILDHWNSGQWVVESSALGFWCSQCSQKKKKKSLRSSSVQLCGGAASAAIDATCPLQQPEFSVSSKDDKRCNSWNMETWEVGMGFSLYVGISMTIMLSVILNDYMNIYMLHPKNCECCPMSLLINWRVTMNADIVVLKWNQCLKAHKGPGSFFEGVLQMSLSLSCLSSQRNS